MVKLKLGKGTYKIPSFLDQRIPLSAKYPHHKLSERDRISICTWYSKGWTVEQLADRYGVSRTLIRYTLKRKEKK